MAGREMAGAEIPEPRSEPIVALQDVRLTVGGFEALRGITVEFPAGKSSVIMGPSVSLEDNARVARRFRLSWLHGLKPTVGLNGAQHPPVVCSQSK